MMELSFLRHDVEYRVRHAIPLILSVVVMLHGAVGHAAGLYLWEFATPGTGTANAGSGAVGRDASTQLFNPAAMTRLDEHQILIGAAPGFTTVEFDPDSNSPAGTRDGGEQGDFVPLFSATTYTR